MGRIDTKLKFTDLFPYRIDGLCRCGCGAKLTGRKTSWFSKKCSDKAYEEYSFKKGWSSALRAAVYKRDRGICATCGADCNAYTASGRKTKNGRNGTFEIHHVVAVIEGGKTDLSNLVTLCREDHKIETAKLRARLSKAKKKII